MRSLNDPILDAKMLCSKAPHTEADLCTELVKLGWAENVASEAVKFATGAYIVKDASGLFVPKGSP